MFVDRPTVESYRQVSRRDGQTGRQTDKMLCNPVPFRVEVDGEETVTLRARSG